MQLPAHPKLGNWTMEEAPSRCGERPRRHVDGGVEGPALLL